jgi:prophage DNA circulation protein
MTTARERLRPILALTSPDGDEFTANWIGDPREAEKKLGTFNYPGVVGTVVQDLGLNSWSWPLTFYFDGGDHDLDADRFMKATLQTGQWAIIHPVYGFLGLQLVSVRENIEPVREGNIREFETGWIEPIDPDTLQTAAQTAGLVGIQKDLFAINAADQFVNGLSALDSLDDWSILNAINKLNSAVNSVLGPLANQIAAVQNEMLQIQSGIQQTLNATILQPLALAGQLQALVETPLKAINDIKSRLGFYADFAEEIFKIQPAQDGSQTNRQGKNTAVIQQIALTSTISANAQIAATDPTKSEIISQKEAVDSASGINDQFIAIVNNLDETQTLFENEDIDEQHFSQPQSHTDAARITALAIQALYISSYDLKKEVRFTLERPRVPAEIAITSYRGPGENDANIDLFIDSNGLVGEEILLLPSGREVLIYA